MDGDIKLFGLLTIPVFVIVIIAILALVILCSIAFPITMAVVSEVGYCDTYPEIIPELEYKWGFWSGCMVNTSEYGWVHAIDYFNLNRAGIELENRSK